MSETDIDYNQHHGSFGAILLICLGIIFLLNNLGILPWTIWLSLWRLWPVLLILAGLQAVFRGSKVADWLIYLFGLILAVVVVYLVIHFSNGQLKNEMNNYFPGNLRLPGIQNGQ
jgi:ABC-type polysaccharide/polyol phosphate export permease